MVAFNKRRSKKSAPAWHKVFLRMLPKIVSYARSAFRHRDPEAREDLVQEVVANACVAFKALWARGKQALAYATVLANYGIRQVRDHRKVGGKLNIKDVLSPYCQKRKGVVVERLDRFDEEENAWQEAVVEDTRTTPVPDIVAFRVDFADWLKSLRRRDRRMAESLALGNRTGDVAKRFNVSAGRVSQLRRELAESWRAFTGEPDGSAAA
jgi:RNA polymerase sigma factor (sigma-70 family)